ncbi:hypothetical protein JET18_07885 [Chryseobacterium sp. L7]|uniref:Tetratricopeptide repeat protein n=1 Tax=Chryseobacterium endalhagicum TaxID=2797638 RepID=A0ABS1QEK6_9FLAO|nr:hypothetical protein [Chryseobacterium endalhagicum]MBL1220751.1 hypothetical protein [Chryseobacterium endalhagicum]
MKKNFLFILILSFSALTAQLNFKLLEGNWIVNKKEFKDGSRYIPFRQMKNWDKVFIFQSNSYYSTEFLRNQTNPFPYKYKTNGNKLSMAEGHFIIIEKLTESDLILVDGNEEREESLHIRYYLTRYDVQKEQDLLKNNARDTLTSTTALSPVPKVNIFGDEFTSSSNFPFRAKGYLFFDMRMKTVKAHFTDSRNLSLQDRGRLEAIYNSTFKSWDFSAVKAFKFIKMPFILALYKYSTTPTISYSRIVTDYNTHDYNDIILPDPFQNPQESLKYFVKGIKCVENEKYDCALQNFKLSFERDKYNFDSHYNYAAINHTLGKKDEACKKWTELIQYGQKKAEVYYKTHCNK